MFGGRVMHPLSDGAEPTLPTLLSRDEGGQKLNVSSGPTRGGPGEPDPSFLPRSSKKPHGMCPLEGGLPSVCASPSGGPWARAPLWLSSVLWPSRPLEKVQP